jgi:hypothetical protein
MVAAQCQAIQPVDEPGAVAALGGERKVLRDAPEAGGHLGGVEGRFLVQKSLELVPFRCMSELEGRLLHWRPAK